MLKLGTPELMFLLIIVGVLVMKDPRQRKVMLMALLAAMITAVVLPESFFAVVAALLGTIAVLGIADLLKRA